jgi:hypothetical protein
VVGRTALALAAALMAAIGAAQAQALQRLSVDSFALSSDTPRPSVGVPFRLVLSLRVRERVAQIENLDLPMMAQLELLGDERQSIAGPRGTRYRETITVLAHSPGALAISPATLQAIDARDGRPKEWYTNSLTLQVSGGGSQSIPNALRLAANGALTILWLVLWAVGLVCVAIIAVVIFRRRRPSVIPKPRPVPTPHEVPLPTPARHRRAEDALTVLRAEPTRAAAVRVRAAIWRMVGASDGETLADVLRRPESSDVTTRGLLIALERSAFTYDDDLAPAIDDACSALERYIESGVSS